MQKKKTASQLSPQSGSPRRLFDLCYFRKSRPPIASSAKRFRSTTQITVSNPALRGVKNTVDLLVGSCSVDICLRTHAELRLQFLHIL